MNNYRPPNTSDTTIPIGIILFLIAIGFLAIAAYQGYYVFAWEPFVGGILGAAAASAISCWRIR